MGILDFLSRYRTWSWHYEQVLGTSLELHVTASSEVAARAAEERALETVDKLNGTLSGWLANTELSRWCATFGADVPVSDALLEVLALGEQWRARTHGAFHPGAQAVIDFLRDDGAPVAQVRASNTPRLTRDALVAALAAPLWRVDRAKHTAANLTRLPISLDAVAKGYIIDRAAESAREVHGVRDVLLNIGGDLRHIGARAVRASIADPFSPAENAAPIATVRLHNQTLATSGGYHRQFPSQGRAVSHLVDPRTLQPAEQVVSSSVIARECATADALSTACSVLTPAESVALVEATAGAACLLIEANGTRTTSSRWSSHED